MSAFKMAFIADIHHYSQKLGNNGRAYELREGSDQKCLKETGAIIDTVFDTFKKDKTLSCVCIAGDITNDGEKISHEEVHKKFCSLNKNKNLYLITSTHDWCSDKNPRRFEGNKVYSDVEVLSTQDLTEYYKQFGEENCISSFTTPLGLVSRCFQLCEGLRLLAINDDCNGKGGKSGYDENHLNWMIEMLNKAKEDSCKVIAMEHHLLLHPLCSLVNKGQSIADNFEIAGILADSGLRLMIVGHSHMQRTTEFVSEKGNKITQINLGSLTGYPAPITYMEFDGQKLNVSTEFLDKFNYEGKELDFSFIEKHTTGVLLNLLMAGKTDKKDFYERLESNGIKIPSYNLLYPLIKAVCKKLLKAKCKGTGRLINILTFGKAIDKKSLQAIKDEKLLDLIIKVYLCIFDGSAFVSQITQSEKTVICDVGKLPSRIVKHLPIKKAKKEKILALTNQINTITQELMYPQKPDNLKTEIYL